MKSYKIFFLLLLFGAGCYSTDNSVKSTGVDNTAAVRTAAVTAEEAIIIYGLVKVEGDRVYIVTNWRSRSMVTYTVSGIKRPELAAANGKYASVSGILTEKKTWSGTIDVRGINSVDDTPDPAKGRFVRPFKVRDAQ